MYSKNYLFYNKNYFIYPTYTHEFLNHNNKCLVLNISGFDKYYLFISYIQMKAKIAIENCRANIF